MQIFTVGLKVASRFCEKSKSLLSNGDEAVRQPGQSDRQHVVFGNTQMRRYCFG